VERAIEERRGPGRITFALPLEIPDSHVNAGEWEHQAVEDATDGVGELNRKRLVVEVIPISISPLGPWALRMSSN
jgi:hypothetical protein